MAWRLCQLVISLSLVLWLISKVDSGTVSAIASFPPSVLAISLVVFATGQIFGALRLWVLLRSQDAYFPPLYLMRLTFVGFFTNNFLPSTVGGDIYKAAALTRRGHDLKLTILTLVADRVLNLIIVVLMTAIALPFTNFWDLRPGMTDTSIAFLAICATAGLIILIGFGFLTVRSQLFKQAVMRFGYRMVAVAKPAFRFIKIPSAFALAILFSGLSVSASILAQFMIAEALGMTINVMQLTAVIGLVTLATLMPVSINGIGIQETGLVALFQLLGIAQEPAIAFALFSRILILGTSLIGGILLLFAGDKKPARLSAGD